VRRLVDPGASRGRTSDRDPAGGLRHHPDDVVVDEHDVDRVRWTTGFVSLRAGQ
jgi:hypothetical protein